LFTFGKESQEKMEETKMGKDSKTETAQPSVEATIARIKELVVPDQKKKKRRLAEITFEHDLPTGTVQDVAEFLQSFSKAEQSSITWSNCEWDPFYTAKHDPFLLKRLLGVDATPPDWLHSLYADNIYPTYNNLSPSLPEPDHVIIANVHMYKQDAQSARAFFNEKCPASAKFLTIRTGRATANRFVTRSDQF